MTRTTNSNVKMHGRQRGAALVVGMIMLAILTLLAITAMNTSSTELVMAGNEQFRERAFQMAEAGIERAVRDLSKVKQDGVAIDSVVTKSKSQPDDSFRTTSKYTGEDDDIPGFSAGKFVGLHYRIDSTGSSVRNAQAVQTQGAYVLGGGGSGDTVRPLPGSTAAL